MTAHTKAEQLEAKLQEHIDALRATIEALEARVKALEVGKADKPAPFTEQPH